MLIHSKIIHPLCVNIHFLWSITTFSKIKLVRRGALFYIFADLFKIQLDSHSDICIQSVGLIEVSEENLDPHSKAQTRAGQQGAWETKFKEACSPWLWPHAAGSECGPP